MKEWETQAAGKENSGPRVLKGPALMWNQGPGTSPPGGGLFNSIFGSSRCFKLKCMQVEISYIQLKNLTWKPIQKGVCFPQSGEVY